MTESIHGRLQRIRFRRREKFRFSDEIRIIPRWLVAAVGVLYLLALGIAVTLDWQLKPLLLAGVITAISIPVAAYIFLVAYVNRDAKRRGMSPTLWTLLAIFLPGTPLSGCIIYFLVREPLPYSCPQCGLQVRADFNFCPQCKRNLHPACPNCGREVGEGDHYCPSCAWELAAPVER